MAARSRSRRADARKNRDRLLNAAREVLAERGFEAEIDEIAARAKIGAGTVYRNFGSREDLILEVTRELVNKTAVEVLAVAAQQEDARQAVRRTMEIGFQRVEEYGALAIQLVAGVAPEPYGRVMNREALAHVFRLLLRRGIDQGHFRSDLDIEYATAVWFALVSPGAFRMLSDRAPGEIARLVSDFYLAGIGVGDRDEGRDQP